MFSCHGKSVTASLNFEILKYSENEIMTLVNIILTAASIFASGMAIFFAVGYIAYKGNKKRNYYN